MEKLKLIRPTLEYKEQVIEYVLEHLRVGSPLNGSGGLNHYVNESEQNYEGWLDNVYDSVYNPKPGIVPGLTYLLVRVSDNYLIGMINIRLVLNSELLKSGGNIGYGIRPSERGKGYNKINLYLALEICQKYHLKEVLLDCSVNNPASEKTMISLGGELVLEYQNEKYGLCHKYLININESLEKYRNIYGQRNKR